MPDEETFFVVVGVNEPTGDSVGVVAANLAGVGMEDIDAIDADLYLAGRSASSPFGLEVVNVGLAEDNEEVCPCRSS